MYSDFCKSLHPALFGGINDITMAKMLDQSIKLPRIENIINEYKR